MELLDWSLLNATLRMVAPILLAALGGMLCTRVGIFNVGLEGLILIGAFSGIAGNYYTHNVFFAIVIAAGASLIFALLFGMMVVVFKANEIVVGVSINFLALGLTTFLLRTIFHTKGAYYDKNMHGIGTWDIPLIKDIPVIGDVISGQSPLVYFSFLAAIAFYIFFYRTIFGFRLLAAGYNQVAASTLGLKTIRYQLFAIAACGILCGIAGAQLSLGQVTMFSEGMTSGRGFIALVAMMLGQSQPLGILASSILFGLMDAVSTRLQGFSIPTEFTMMVPYVLTLAAMFFLRDKGVETNQTSQQSAR
ncbi:ABC transporter permease [Priestia aryabhattai]|uniref:ABC transporter permease n=1 Tax=Priestia aryabhattai TaxID=412384 RepID=UPI0008DCB618|nr:ABC transporter permease [Priestia aryabhattai]MBZ6486271.1 ABC transporter permease [Priestia aryabhattai]MDH3113258.1 ABC transporter permease [Priestia aryabhattai]MDH3127836.1 ABC transporter permease [Priestia aryabhattai]MDH3131924.1 ABC transporter permease [Priestia aryabhattai]MED4152438.1 ABC transporter permease [Priestia aryabhattai]